MIHAPVTISHEHRHDGRRRAGYAAGDAFRDDERYAPEYNVTYIRREKVDEITCYVFSLQPKVLTKDRKRYFDGDVWVDDQDLQIVKTYGRSTGYLRRGEDQQFPKFETYREQIDGKYWFPTYTYADDTLNFKDGPSQRIKEVIKYDHYKKFQFKTESTIKYGDVGGAEGQATPIRAETEESTAKSTEAVKIALLFSRTRPCMQPVRPRRMSVISAN